MICNPFRMHEWELLEWFMALFVVFCVSIVVWAFQEKAAHQRLLEEKGCIIEKEWDTGRRIQCGKGCSRLEKLTLFECKDGRRVEIDGTNFVGKEDPK